jgi:hypothetical protein
MTAALSVLVIACLSLNVEMSTRTLGSREKLFAEDNERLARHALLKKRLSTTDPNEFRSAIRELTSLDEAGALNLWTTALNSRDSQLTDEAWQAYNGVRIQLTRRESVPQVVKIAANSSHLLRVATSADLETMIWKESDDSTIAAAPPFLVERLQRQGVQVEVLYDSIAAWQQARSGGVELAKTIVPRYQQTDPADTVRIAVIEELPGQPAPGYSTWLGDAENILMRHDGLVAFLDILPSDSTESIEEHIQERYTKRGYRLHGFYTTEEFAEAAPRFFPGKRFEPGRKPSPKDDLINIVPELSEGRFHTYDETLAEFTQLAQNNPGLAQLVNLGPTYENRQIFALKIAKDPSIDDPSKPEVLITGCHHAREWISVEVPVFFANRLVKGYATDNSIRHLVDNLQIWIVPIVNPDGLNFSQGRPNDSVDSTRLWRKNRRPISVDGCGSSIGVDLNRNYGFQWRLSGDEPCPKSTDDNGASDDLKHETYRGPTPDSELELKALKTLVDNPMRRFRAELDYHNFGQLILYPWGYQSDHSLDDATLSHLAVRMSEEIETVNRQVYRPQQAINLYTTTGASVDYSYGANRIPASFTIETRPTCCGFGVLERDIDLISTENWAGAQVLLRWATGPPILESVTALQRATDGTFSKEVYAAHWVQSAESGGQRALILDNRFPGLEPGSIRVRLQFSKPMDPQQQPQVHLGRSFPVSELTFSVGDATQGWTTTLYPNDTWIGEAAIPPDQNQPSPWRLAVSATDGTPSELDAMPQTLASYAIGTDSWNGYESFFGTGSEGGQDLAHTFSPTLGSETLGIFVASPSGGERLPAGEPFLVTWRVPRQPGFVPSHQELKLSLDGGLNFSTFANDLGGDLEKLLVLLPQVTTTRARLRVVATESTVGNFIFGDNEADFTIGANVGSGVEISFASSERVDLSWTEAPTDENPSGINGTSRLILNLNVTNRSGVPVQNPFLVIDKLTGSHVLLSRDRSSAQRVSARQSFVAGGDNILSSGETTQLQMTIGLVDRKKVTVAVEVFGVPVGGTIGPAPSVRVWKGKPKNKSA